MSEKEANNLETKQPVSEPVDSSHKPPRDNKATSPEWLTILGTLSGLASKAMGLGIGTIYITGFLVFNANLAKHGVINSQLLSSNYLVAGALFLFFLVCFYLFAGRAVLLGKTWLSEDIAALKRVDKGSAWPFLAFLESFVHLAFFLCLSAASFSYVAFSKLETAAFYVWLCAGFGIHYTLDITNLDVKYPRTNLMAKFATKLPAIFAFFALAKTTRPVLVVVSYFGIAIYMNLVLDTLERYRITRDRLTFTFGYAFVFLVITAAGFGTFIFGDIDTRIGGGQPVPVTIGLSETLASSLGNRLDGKSVVDGKIVHSSEDYLFIESAAQVYRVPESGILWLSFWKDRELETQKAASPNASTLPQKGKSQSANASGESR